MVQAQVSPSGWDYWEVMHESVDELRRRYDIKPLEPEIAKSMSLRAWAV